MHGGHAQSEWAILYKALFELLQSHGKNSSLGDGDYWLVDDNWGSVDQRLIIFNPRVLTMKLISEISALIRSLELLGASVMIALESMDHEVTVPAEGIVVHSSGFTEYWDKPLLREKLGSSFAF